MGSVTVRDLRNHGGEVLERVARGETLTVTRDGRPVAELRAVCGRPLPAETLSSRWKALPRVDPATLRTDIDNVLDAFP
jgi:antitoxin (DNA-binding transcriptional repressor) of toxin-antitoxin stability system